MKNSAVPPILLNHPNVRSIMFTVYHTTARATMRQHHHS
jgi:hypothetical protein